MRPRLDHPHEKPQGRLKVYSVFDRRQGERLHPLFENTFRRAKKHAGGGRMERFLKIDRSRG